MSKIIVRFPDPMLATLDVLRPALPAIRFGTVTPEEMPEPPLPYVMVRLDGSFISDLVVKTATIRISVWHRTEAECLDLAGTVEAVLLGYPGGEAVRSIGPLTGAFPTTDPDTGNPLSSFTVAVRLRPLTPS